MARFTVGLARHAPIITTGASITYLDIDDTVRATFGYAKQGTGFGYSGVKGLNALLGTVSTASSAPVYAVAAQALTGDPQAASTTVSSGCRRLRSCGASPGL